MCCRLRLGLSLKLPLHDAAVLVETSLDALHLAVATHPQLVAHHADQTFVVRDKDHSTLQQHEVSESPVLQ